MRGFHRTDAIQLARASIVRRHFENVTVTSVFFQKCKVSENDIQRALLAGDPQDQLVIAYNLVIDNKRIADEGNVIVCNWV